MGKPMVGPALASADGPLLPIGDFLGLLWTIGTLAPDEIPCQCPEEMRKRLHDEVNKHCKTGKRACNSQQDLITLMANRDQNYRCAQARHDINVQCFDGGDKEHQYQMWEAILAMKECEGYIQHLLKKKP
jgi:hypothetical protein